MRDGPVEAPDEGGRAAVAWGTAALDTTGKDASRKDSVLGTWGDRLLARGCGGPPFFEEPLLMDCDGVPTPQAASARGGVREQMTQRLHHRRNPLAFWFTP